MDDQVTQTLAPTTMPDTLQIIVPLMARTASRSWDHTLKLLSYSLRSFSQLADVSVLIVGHDYPTGVALGPNCEWLEASFAPPCDDSASAKMRDKGLKSRLGVQHAATSGRHKWVMVADADDFISRNLLKFADFANHDAIYLSRGYRWTPGRPYCELIPEFHLVCGTSWMMRLTTANFPVWLAHGRGPRVCDQPHNKRLAGLCSIGARVQRVDCPAAIYVCHKTNSYYNHEQPHRAAYKLFRSLFASARAATRARLMTREFCSEFGVHESAINKSEDS